MLKLLLKRKLNPVRKTLVFFLLALCVQNRAIYGSEDVHAPENGPPRSSTRPVAEPKYFPPVDETEDLIEVGGDLDQVYSVDLDDSARGVGKSTMIDNLSVTQLKTLNLKDGGKIMAMIVQPGNEVYVRYLSKTGQPTSIDWPLGGFPANQIILGRDANGNPLLFAINDKDHRPYIFDLKPIYGDVPSGTFKPVGKGTAKNLAITNDANGNPLLFEISGKDNQVYSMKFDGTGNPSGDFSLVGSGTAMGLVTGQDKAGNPIIYTIDDKDHKIHEMNFSPSGDPVGTYTTVGDLATPLIKLWSRRGSDPILFAAGAKDRNVYSEKLNDDGKPAGKFTKIGDGPVQALSIATHDGKPTLFEVNAKDAHPYAIQYDSPKDIAAGFHIVNHDTVHHLANNMFWEVVGGVIAIGMLVDAVAERGNWGGNVEKWIDPSVIAANPTHVGVPQFPVLPSSEDGDNSTNGMGQSMPSWDQVTPTETVNPDGTITIDLSGTGVVPPGTSDNSPSTGDDDHSGTDHGTNTDLGDIGSVTPETNDHPTVDDDHSQGNDHPVADNHPDVEDHPVVDDHPAVEDHPVAEEHPAVEDHPVAEEHPAMEDHPVAEAHPAMEDHPVAEEHPGVEE